MSVKNSKRGFTLVEMIIAITVIMLVSAAAAGVVISASESANTNHLRFTADSLVRDIIECARFSGNMDVSNEETVFCKSLAKVGITVGANPEGAADGTLTLLYGEKYVITVAPAEESGYVTTSVRYGDHERVYSEQTFRMP